MTDDLLTTFRSAVPLADETMARQAYARATSAGRRVTTRRAVAIGAAAACLAGGGAALALTPPSPSRTGPGMNLHGPSRGQTATGGLTGTSADCGIETQTNPLPPAGFDPTKATQAELQEYGFPPRPPGDSSGALRAWLKAMAAWKTMDVAEPTCSTVTHGPPPVTRG